MKKLLSILILLVTFSGCDSNNLDSTVKTKLYESDNHQEFFVDIKYRDDDVDVGDPRFEYLNTSKSSWIKGAWYDNDYGYMVINLDGTYYHYCDMPESIWNKYESADSFGSDYRSYIKGNYDCREGYVPSY